MHPVTEHIVRTNRHTTFYLGCGAPDATPMIFVHGWPGVVDQLAPSAPGLCRPGLSLHRPRHARLWPLQRVFPARGLCTGTQRRRHDRTARQPWRGKGDLGRPRLGQPRCLEPCRPSSGPMLRHHQSLRAVPARRFRAGRDHPPGRPLDLSASRVPRRPVGIPALLRRELRQGQCGVRGQPARYRQSSFSARAVRPARGSLHAPRSCAATAAGSAAPVVPQTCLGMPMC